MQVAAALPPDVRGPGRRGRPPGHTSDTRMPGPVGAACYFLRQQDTGTLALGYTSSTLPLVDPLTMIKLGIDAPPSSRTAQVVQILEADIEIQTLWYMANRTSDRK